MSKLQIKSIRFLGITSIAFGSCSFLINFIFLLGCFLNFFEHMVQYNNLPYFYTSFYIISSLNMFCYFTLIFCGIKFLRFETRFIGLFVSLLIFEISYPLIVFFASSHGWSIRNLNVSLSVAAPFAMAGLIIQYITLFPIWGIVLAILSERKTNQMQGQF